MDFSLGTYGLGIVAGILSTLSPCVLPLIPLVVRPAASAHPLGLLALSSGLALSFTVIGLLVATIGLAAGLDADFFRRGRHTHGRVRLGASVRAIPGPVCRRGGSIQRPRQRPHAECDRQRDREPVYDRIAARRRVESVCRPDARCCLPCR